MREMGRMADGPCDPRRAIGLFEIERALDYTAVSGAVAGAVPPTMGRMEVARAGDCRLLRRDNAFCNPPCGAGTLCGREGQCLRYPDTISVGTVSIQGLKQPVRMEPKSQNQYFDTSLPPAAFDEGATIRLEASGGAGPAFAIQASGIALLELADEGNIIAADRDFPIRWTPGRVPARMRVEINVDQHGTTPATLICELADAGQLTLQASLVGQLLGFGVSGFPTLTVTRQAAGSTELASGCIGLELSSPVSRALSVQGHTPCKRDADCPVGMRCDLPAEACR
jgi:hypothetical protein